MSIQAKAATLPKGSVECTFPQKGNKQIIAKQGQPLSQVISKAGLRVKFDCKNGRCGTCQVRLNGRSAAKICQKATVRIDRRSRTPRGTIERRDCWADRERAVLSQVPGGATRKLTITLDNP